MSAAGGVFAVARGVFDHPLFANEPYSEREAWLWLVSEAAWKPRRVRVRNGVVDLQRGQLAHATRFMAAKWQWSEARVRRFLTRLKSDAMIDAHSDAHATLITICKYDEYQRVSARTDAQNDADYDAHATRTRRKEEYREYREEKKENKERASAPVDHLVLVIDRERAEAVVAHRKAFRKPLTPRSAELLARSLAACPDPAAAADRMLERGWLTVKPEWMADATGPPRGRSQNGMAAVAIEKGLAFLDEQYHHHTEADRPGASSPADPGTASFAVGPDERGNGREWPDGSPPRKADQRGRAPGHAGPVIDLEAIPRRA